MGLGQTLRRLDDRVLGPVGREPADPRQHLPWMLGMALVFQASSLIAGAEHFGPLVLVLIASALLLVLQPKLHLPSVTPAQVVLLILAAAVVAVPLQLWTRAPWQWTTLLYQAPLFYGIVAPRRRDAEEQSS